MVETRCSLLSRLANVVVIAMAACVLTGWALNLRPLVHLFPSMVAMNPTTALGLLLAGVCFWSLGHTSPGQSGTRNAWILRRHLSLPMEALLDSIIQDVQRFTRTPEFEDDVCIVGIDVTHLMGR